MMLMGRLGLRRMTAGAMPLAVGADGRWDGATGGVLVVMVAGGCCADRVAVLADDPPTTWSNGSGRHRTHPRARPYGATTPST